MVTVTGTSELSDSQEKPTHYPGTELMEILR